MTISAQTLSAAVADLLGVAVDRASAARVAGGSIHQAWRISTARGFVFVKAAGAALAFDAEAAGLATLRAANAVRVPTVLATSSTPALSLIALEWLEFAADSGSGDALLGAQLAAQHRVTATQFGWHRDNTIGATPQPNGWSGRWIEFLRQQRLGFQLELAARALRAKHRSALHADLRLIERGQLLCESLGALFDGYQPVPSLLHGDLWSGNRATLADGQPVIFDPAVYFGDREADLAMTRLFGGFAAAFYSAYDASWPVDAGARARRPLYNLYHVLNHFNLFGGAYRQQAESMIDQLLAETGH